jgi:hypothetical protein
VQHKEWFIVGLLPHIIVLLTQQKMMTQAEVIEIAMHLETTIGEVETSTSAVATSQSNDAVARYGQDKGHAQACMVYHMSLIRAS